MRLLLEDAWLFTGCMGQMRFRQTPDGMPHAFIFCAMEPCARLFIVATVRQ